MTFLVIHERGNWSAIRLAKTIEEAKKELLKMVQEATVEWGDVFRISKGRNHGRLRSIFRSTATRPIIRKTAVLREQRSYHSAAGRLNKSTTPS